MNNLTSPVVKRPSIDVLASPKRRNSFSTINTFVPRQELRRALESFSEMDQLSSRNEGDEVREISLSDLEEAPVNNLVNDVNLYDPYQANPLQSKFRLRRNLFIVVLSLGAVIVMVIITSGSADVDEAVSSVIDPLTEAAFATQCSETVDFLAAGTGSGDSLSQGSLYGVCQGDGIALICNLELDREEGSYNGVVEVENCAQSCSCNLGDLIALNGEIDDICSEPSDELLCPIYSLPPTQAPTEGPDFDSTLSDLEAQCNQDSGTTFQACLTSQAVFHCQAGMGFLLSCGEALCGCPIGQLTSSSVLDDICQGIEAACL